MKNIGVVCDDYKTVKFRKTFLSEGFTLSHDGDSGIKGTHLFKIQCEDNECEATLERIGKVVKKLELDFKNSN